MQVREFLFISLHFDTLFYRERFVSSEQSVDSETQFRLHLMFVGREWQGMFVEAREKVVKSINLVNCLKRSIEEWSVFDQKLMESFTLLKVRNGNIRLKFSRILIFFCALI